MERGRGRRAGQEVNFSLELVNLEESGEESLRLEGGLLKNPDIT